MYLLDRVGGRDRRHEQDVDVPEYAVACAAQLFQPVERPKRIRGAVPRGRRNDLARNRMHRFRLCFDHVLGREVTLGDPRAVVEEPCGLDEWREVDFRDGPAQR